MFCMSTWDDDESVSEWDDEPELAGYEPHTGRPLRSPRLLMVMRVVVVLGLVSLVLPSIVISVTDASAAARESCRRWVKYAVPSSPGSQASFEVFGSHGVGWQCYSRDAFGGDKFIASLGLIPGVPNIPKTPIISG
jgi:hypothetical protein